MLTESPLFSVLSCLSTFLALVRGVLAVWRVGGGPRVRRSGMIYGRFACLSIAVAESIRAMLTTRLIKLRRLS